MKPTSSPLPNVLAGFSLLFRERPTLSHNTTHDVTGESKQSDVMYTTNQERSKIG